MMEYEELIYEVKGETAIITINRPDWYNALNARAKEELENAIRMVRDDVQVRGVVLTGKGKAFCSGNDVTEKYETRDEAMAVGRRMHALTQSIQDLKKPVVAAVNGYALGGGCELALACDIRIAGEKAVFSFPEVSLGMVPSFGGTQRLPRLIGSGRAKELLFTGRKVKAQEALEIGLVNQVVSQERLMESAMEMMGLIVKNAPLAVMQCKYLIDRGMELTLKEGLLLENEASGMLVETEDNKEGVRAFMEKRTPVFRGR